MRFFLPMSKKNAIFAQNLLNIMRKHILFLFLLSFVGYGCQRPTARVDKSESIPIDASMDAIQDSAYLAYLAPFQETLKQKGDVVLAHAPQPLTYGEPESSILNWSSDALLVQARKYYSGRVDIAVVNKGSMRTEWQAGDITVRNLYELMPFDNELVVLTLQGQDILELCQIFVEDNGQGIANMTIVGEDKQLAEARIDGQPIDPDAYYTVATSDYLANGMDRMTPLTRYIEIWNEHLLIRDLYIDQVKEQNTIPAILDHRFIIL